MRLSSTLANLRNDSKLFEYYYRFLWYPNASSIHRIINDYATRNEDFFFIQIGANDGFTNDPIFNHIRMFDWEGILIEPQTDVFEQLEATYSGNRNLKLVNAAIDEKCGKKEIYKIGFSDSKWATGLSSLEKEMIEKQISRGYVAEKARENGEQLPDSEEDLITTETIETTTFEKLFDRHDVDKVDGLFIDAEGYDSEIMELFDFGTYSPGLVLFEHLHLTTEEELKWIERFSWWDYTVLRGEHNTLVYRGID